MIPVGVSPWLTRSCVFSHYQSARSQFLMDRNVRADNRISQLIVFTFFSRQSVVSDRAS